jgi:hypothetical protein
MQDMNLPDDVMREIREHVAAARVEWELWLRDREEQRLRRTVFDTVWQRGAPNCSTSPRSRTASLSALVAELRGTEGGGLYPDQRSILDLTTSPNEA